MTDQSINSPGRQSALTFVGFSAIAAAVASAAAFATSHLGFLPWAMFVGWVAYFTRPISIRQGICTWLCVAGGLVLGAAAVLSLHTLTSEIGSLALPLVVFVVAMTVVSMRALRALDNILGWFLGLIAFFAAHIDPSVTNIAQLAAATGLGSAAGWIAQQLQTRLASAQ